jgi:nicotinate-nucleotide--dimethylbenzimidazole phosphoribosyltransferase
LPVFARLQHMRLTVVDAGMADAVALPHEQLLVRKIAHGTRNCRVGAAMNLDQAHAALRAGMEIGDALDGNAVACAGLGVGASEAAALVLSRLCERPLRELMRRSTDMAAEELDHLLLVGQAAQARHHDVQDPIEVLASFGGFEIAMMTGLMLVAASKRHLILVDGLPALAALAVACRVAPPVIDYCVFSRSHGRPSLDQALQCLQASALLEVGLDSVDGTGAPLAWPLVRGAAALLTEVADGEEAGPSRPGVSASLMPTLSDELPTVGVPSVA